MEIKELAMDEINPMPTITLDGVIIREDGIVLTSNGHQIGRLVTTSAAVDKIWKDGKINFNSKRLNPNKERDKDG